MTPRRGSRPWLAQVLCVMVLAAESCRPQSAPEAEHEPSVAPPPAVSAPEVRTWKKAAEKVEEDRGEPIGRAASVAVPAELRHYADTRRFLAIQVAEAREQDVTIPIDYGDLARMIEDGELVEVPALGDDYILYGVGANATRDPFTMWDARTGTDIPLYPGWAEYHDAHDAASAEIEKATAEIEALKAQLAKTRVRRTRASLSSAIASRRRQVAASRTEQARLAAWYDDPERRRRLVEEYARLQRLADALRHGPADLDDPATRRWLKGRLLSFLRPPARDVLLQIAKAYHDRFGRPLAVTSLVRNERYQHQLGKSNPNATRIEIPPHATGLAFDLYYHYLTAAEQEFVMGEIARLEDERKVEALRENRDHIHVFVFPDGVRPSERLIADARGVVRAASLRVTTPRRAPSRGASKVARTARRSPSSPARPTARRRSHR